MDTPIDIGDESRSRWNRLNRRRRARGSRLQCQWRSAPIAHGSHALQLVAGKRERYFMGRGSQARNHCSLRAFSTCIQKSNTIQKGSRPSIVEAPPCGHPTISYLPHALGLRVAPGKGRAREGGQAGGAPLDGRGRWAALVLAVDRCGLDGLASGLRVLACVRRGVVAWLHQRAFAAVVLRPRRVRLRLGVENPDLGAEPRPALVRDDWISIPMVRLLRHPAAVPRPARQGLAGQRRRLVPVVRSRPGAWRGRHQLPPAAGDARDRQLGPRVRSQDLDGVGAVGPPEHVDMPARAELAQAVDDPRGEGPLVRVLLAVEVVPGALVARHAAIVPAAAAVAEQAIDGALRVHPYEAVRVHAGAGASEAHAGELQVVAAVAVVEDADRAL